MGAHECVTGKGEGLGAGNARGWGRGSGRGEGREDLSLKCIALSVYLLAVTQKQGDEIINDPINTYLMSTR